MPPTIPQQTFIPQNAFGPSGFMIGDFNVNQGLNQLAGLAGTVAANFAPDPRVRAVRQQAMQEQSAQQQQLLQAQIQASVERFKGISEMVKGIAQANNGQIPPSIQGIVDNETKILGSFMQQAGMDPNQALQLREMTLGQSQIPAPAAPITTGSPGNFLIQNGQVLGQLPPAPSSVEEKAAFLQQMGVQVTPEIAKQLALSGGTNVNVNASPVIQMPGENQMGIVQEGRITELQKNVQQSEENLAEIRRLRGMIEGDVGEAATGVRGVISETVGGLSSQLLGTEGAYGPLGGPPLEDVTTLRTQAQTLMGRMVSAVTGDDSGRYTERDNERVRAATKALDPNASVSQIQAALKNLEEIEVRAGARDRVALQGLDIRSRQGVKEYAKALAAADPSLTPDQAVAEALKDLGLNF